MGSYTVEQVEFLRQRADITYEEALEVLARCNGDLTRCLVDLERNGRIRSNPGAVKTPLTVRPRTGGAANRRRAAQEESKLSTLLKKLVRMRLVVTNGERTYVDLPVAYLIFAAICAPHLMIMTVIAMFVLGMKIRVENNEGANVGNDKFYNTVDQVADNIKTTVDSFTRAAREGGEKAKSEKVEKHTPYAAQGAHSGRPVYAQPSAPEASAPDTSAPDTSAPQESPEEPEIDVDIPEVTPYEAFTGETEAYEADMGDVNTGDVNTGDANADDRDDTDENEITIG